MPLALFPTSCGIIFNKFTKIFKFFSTQIVAKILMLLYIAKILMLLYITNKSILVLFIQIKPGTYSKLVIGIYVYFREVKL